MGVTTPGAGLTLEVYCTNTLRGTFEVVVVQYYMILHEI
jgi:hypothetical protein